jgi:hypothetical protein
VARFKLLLSREPMEVDAVEYPSTETTEPLPESIKASILAAQKKARRREKKAKKNGDGAAVEQADGEAIGASNTEPLTELPDTNSKKQKDKKKKRKHAAENAEVEANGQGSSENLSKAHHS